jgi:hypothetical protein
VWIKGAMIPLGLAEAAVCFIQAEVRGRSTEGADLTAGKAFTT